MTSSDLKYAFRLLVKSPWFTLLTVLMLAGGLAISIYTYTALNTLFYEDLPLPEGDSIVRLRRIEDGQNVLLDGYEVARMRPDVRSLTEIGAYRFSSWAVVGNEQSSRSVRATRTEWSVFEFTRTPPLMGRGFSPDDQIEGSEPVAVLGHGLWESAFVGDPSALGRIVTINGQRTRIVGVMPEDYAFPMNTEVWQPLSQADLAPAGYGEGALEVYARLAPGVPPAAAAAELTTLLQRVQRERPGAENASLHAVDVSTFQRAQWGTLGPRAFAVLNALAVAILLLACVNVGNLLLARTNERMREISIRVALGAPRFRLIVQMMLENVVICVAGGILALVLAARALEFTDGFFRTLLESILPYWWRWSLDGVAVAAAGIFVVLTILLVSVLPTYGLSRIDPNSLLRDGTHGARPRSAGRISRSLVTIEVVLISVVLLTGGTVAVIAYRMANFEWGMDTADLYMMQVELPAKSYATPQAQASLYERLLTELRGRGEIEAAMITRELGHARFAVDNLERYGSDAKGDAEAVLVTRSETPTPLITRLLQGRDFDGRDRSAGERTALVSETLAAIHWPGESALGRRIAVLDPNGVPEERTVVGLVGDIRYDPTNMSRAALAAIYVPLPQLTVPRAQIVVRHRGGEALVREVLYEALGDVDAEVPAGRVMSYDSVLDQLTVFATTLTNLFIGCGAFAVLLAMTGIYGLSRNAVVQRMREIGLRRALGASNRSIIALFLAQGTRQLAIGLSISALVSLAVLLVLSQLAEIAAPVAVSMGVFVVLAVSGLVLASIYISVRGAVESEPSVALRHG